MRELDLAVEARAVERFARNFVAPLNRHSRIYWQWTCPIMNVPGYVNGIPGNDLAAVDAADLITGWLPMVPMPC